MGVMKRILGQNQDNRNKHGYSFTNNNPHIKLQKTKKNTSMLHNPIDYEAFNRDLKAWGKNTARKIKVSAGQFHKGSGALEKSIYPKFRKAGIEIVQIGFNLERHGVFLEKGVGRGYRFENGGVVRYAASEGNLKTMRYPVHWFNKPVSDEIPALQRIVEYNAGKAIELNIERIYIL